MQTTGEQKSVLRGLFAGTALAVLSLTMSVFAAPVPIERVQKLAGGIASSVQVARSSGAVLRMAQAVSAAEAKVSAVAPTNVDETAFYVIDRGSAGGFVVMSADDRLDPVLVIAPTGSFDPTPGTPLYDMLCGDVRKRIAAADASGARQTEGWRSLLDESDPLATSIAYEGLSSIDDVRVDPLVQSKWNQSNVGSKKVYNYYTPKNYVCGCVATALAQVMRAWEWPYCAGEERITKHSVSQGSVMDKGVDIYLRVDARAPFHWEAMGADGALDRFETARLLLWIDSLVEMMFAPAST